MNDCLVVACPDDIIIADGSYVVVICHPLSGPSRWKDYLQHNHRSPPDAIIFVLDGSDLHAIDDAARDLDVSASLCLSSFVVHTLRCDRWWCLQFLLRCLEDPRFKNIPVLVLANKADRKEIQEDVLRRRLGLEKVSRQSSQ